MPPWPAKDCALVALTRQESFKIQLLEAQAFLPVLDDVMTPFDENPQFMRLGKRTRNTLLTTSVIETFRRMTGQALSKNRLLLTRLGEYGFIHGGGMVGGYVLTAIYFKSLQMGMLAVATLFGSSYINMARFTGVTISAGEPG